MKKTILFSSLLLSFFLFSCTSDDSSNGGGEDTTITVTNPYILVLGTDNNAYVFPDIPTFENGDFDSAAESKKSVQLRGDRRVHFYDEDYMYAFAYNQDSPGKSLSFEIKNGVFSMRKEYDLSNGIQARANYKESIIGTYSDREYEPAKVTAENSPNTAVKFFKVAVEQDQLLPPVSWPSFNFDQTQELAYITDIKQYGDHLLTGIRTIKGYLPPNVFPEPILLFDSDFTDRTYVGVFDSNFNLTKIIKDTERTGMIGGMIKATGKTGIEVLDNGDVYAFCSAFSSTERPSGILKINTSDFSFDKDFFFNISQASGGKKLFRSHYLGGTLFCLQLFKQTGLDVTKYYDAPGAASSFAIFDIATQSLTMLTDEIQNVKLITDPFIDKDAKKIYFGINTTSDVPSIYVIDALQKTMTKGLVVRGQEIRALGKLKVN